MRMMADVGAGAVQDPRRTQDAPSRRGCSQFSVRGDRAPTVPILGFLRYSRVSQLCNRERNAESF